MKFSFERYRGASQSLLKQRVAAVETPDAQHVRFRLKEPWPDFLTFYAGVSGAAWIVPRKYVTQVGDEGFKKAPIGAGPYRFVSFTPGVELVLEAFEGYWRNPPRVKRLVMKVIPDEATRLAALKRGEIDIAFSIRGELAGELLQTPGLSLKPVVIQGVFCVYFVDQWDPKSPWHDVRVRRAANLAIDCKTINEALTRGYSHVTGNPFVPDIFEFYWQPPAPVYDPAQAKQLLASAGYPNGFDAGFYNCDSSYSNIAEAVVNNWGEVGIRIKLRPMERAAYIKAFAEKTYKNVIQAGPAGFGNAATQVGDPCGPGRHVHLWQLPGSRRVVRAAGGRAELQAPRGDPAPDAADRARAGDLRTDLAARVHQWRGSARRRVGLRAHPGLPLHGAVRRVGAEGGIACGTDGAGRLLGGTNKKPSSLSASLSPSWPGLSRPSSWQSCHD